jgi:hypothetical protein
VCDVGLESKSTTTHRIAVTCPIIAHECCCAAFPPTYTYMLAAVNTARILLTSILCTPPGFFLAISPCARSGLWWCLHRPSSSSHPAAFSPATSLASCTACCTLAMHSTTTPQTQQHPAAAALLLLLRRRGPGCQGGMLACRRICRCGMCGVALWGLRTRGGICRGSSRSQRCR